MRRLAAIILCAWRRDVEKEDPDKSHLCCPVRPGLDWPSSRNGGREHQDPPRKRGNAWLMKVTRLSE